MLEVVIDGNRSDSKVVFNKGDFFLTDTDDLRRIIQNANGKFQAINVKAGHVIGVIGSFNTVEELVSNYVSKYDEIEKVEVNQIVVRRTGEVLK